MNISITQQEHEALQKIPEAILQIISNNENINEATSLIFDSIFTDVIGQYLFDPDNKDSFWNLFSSKEKEKINKSVKLFEDSISKLIQNLNKEQIYCLQLSLISRLQSVMDNIHEGNIERPSSD